ncbi:anthocyanidin 5,3-O-glucosyltransferase-like [Pyrus ussuriensis x Pyrus communis]|uniref:Anthocyanidin 5,3-O-glucosyltransferase-like n=1 Tax=Pyrus ussuriensis x Pyrus communis TaxID=2448454 RepID=A0A5N5GDA5_9ROSA|nr:anthocyanidin 5,3-O-glucosyltransferase-like [Pyrus ussuriensis x Pyrus communis]
MIEPVLDRDDLAYWDFLSFFSYLSKSKGIIVNTFEELEPPAILQAIAEGLCKFHALGDGYEFHGVGRSATFVEAEVSSAVGFGGEAVGEESVILSLSRPSKQAAPTKSP